MTKRVAWFTGKATNGSVTPHKVYDVFNEDGNSFNLKDDSGGTRLCLKEQCAHICHGDWVFADIVEEIKEAVTEVVEQADTKPKKAKKWSAWIPHTTGKQPVDDGIVVKTKFSLGSLDKDRADAYFWEDKKLTHYKVQLKDQEKTKTKWTKNTGVNPLNTDARVKIVRRDSGKVVMKARYCDWSLNGHSYDIIKWRLAD